MCPLIETFDEFESTAQSSVETDFKPFQFRDGVNEKGGTVDKTTLEWLNTFWNMCLQVGQSRFEVYRRYVKYYKNIQWNAQTPRDYNRDTSNIGKRNPRMSLNYVFDAVESKVSSGAKNKIAIAVIPNDGSDQKDINNAKLFKMLLDHRAKEVDMDWIQQQADRYKYIFGHCFIWTYWDEQTGKLNPAYESFKNEGKELPKDIIKKMKEMGTEEVRVGDVCYRVLGPNRCFPEIGKRHWDDVDYVDIVEWKPLEEMKHTYPEHAKSIEQENSSSIAQLQNVELDDYKLMGNYVMIHHFYHKPTKFLSKGAYIKWCAGAVLEQGDFPYTHNMLPVVPDKDIEIPDELWGRSFIGNIEQLQRFNNNIQSAIARNESIGSHPKWLVPKGSCKFTSLNNEMTIAEYTGAQPPKLQEFNGTHPRTLEIMDRNEKKIYAHSQIYEISRGEVPTGITANSALRFLDDQETQRNSTQIAKRRSRVLKTYQMTKALMSQFYDKSDNRTIKIVGETNEYIIRNMNDVDTTKEYDIKLQLTSALPETMAGKISTIIDLNTASQTDPPFRRPEIIQLMGLGADDTFKDQATISATAAGTIVDRLLRGEEVAPPQRYDNYLVHYDVFNRTLQSFTYKSATSPAIRQKFEEYVMTLEGLMFLRARTNIKFLTELMALDMYPMFFTLPMPLIQVQQTMAQLAQAPMGAQAPAMGGATGAAPMETQKIEKIPELNSLQEG